MSQRFTYLGQDVASSAGKNIDFPFGGRIRAIEFSQMGFANAGASSNAFLELAKVNVTQLASANGKEIVATHCIAGGSGIGAHASLVVPCDESVRAGDRWYVSVTNSGANWVSHQYAITFIFA